MFIALHTKVRHWPHAPPPSTNKQASLRVMQAAAAVSCACLRFKYGGAVKLVGMSGRGGGGPATGRYVGRSWPATAVPIATLCVRVCVCVWQLILSLIKQQTM
jgi:hypothetical protein